MRRKARYTHGDTTPDSPSLPEDGIRRAFARRLQQAINEKGWSQADLTRELAKFMDEPPHRSLVSNYIRQKSLPQPEKLHALAKALGMKPNELLPTNIDNEAVAQQSAAADLRDIGGGKVWLRINQAVTWASALKILEVLKGENVVQTQA